MWVRVDGKWRCPFLPHFVYLQNRDERDMVYFNILLRKSHISKNSIFQRLNFKDCPLNDVFSELLLNIISLRLKIG